MLFSLARDLVLDPVDQKLFSGLILFGLDFVGLDFELALLPVKLLSDMTRRSGEGFAGVVVEVEVEVESERALRLLNRDRRLDPPLSVLV